VVSTLLWAAALVAPFMADALVLFGVLVMTLAEYGVVRMPDAYTRQHAASKMVFLGVITLLLASALPWDKDIVLRVTLIAVFLLLTIPRSRRTWSSRLFQGRMRASESADTSNRNPATAEADR
jgi:multicomponent Na+:H+ antiporter subunit G